jgi:hypothetical protein
MTTLDTFTEDDGTSMKIPTEKPEQRTLNYRVERLCKNHSYTLRHDDLLTLYYHLTYDGWDIVSENPNHLVITIPEDRSGERSDASIVRARRDVERTDQFGPADLDLYIRNEWEDEEEWESYIRDRQEEQLEERGADIQDLPVGFEDQVLWVLLNVPETRDSDKDLILQWRLIWGGWTGDPGGQVYGVPKDWEYRTTTPESITAARRKWNQMGIALPSDSVKQRREGKEQKVRQAYKEGRSPWEWLK